MTKQHTIVFLHSRGLVPPEVIHMVNEQLPAGFRMDFLEQSSPADTRLEKIARADFILAYPGNPTEDELNAAKQLKLFQMLSAGYEWIDLGLFQKLGVPVANNGGANAPTVAEHAILLILAVFKKLPLHHNTLHEGQWLGARETLQMRELRNKTVGIIGFGRIGREFARIAKGFQANILYYDTVRAPTAVEQEVGAERLALDDLLQRADVVFCSYAADRRDQGTHQRPDAQPDETLRHSGQYVTRTGNRRTRTHRSATKQSHRRGRTGCFYCRAPGNRQPAVSAGQCSADLTYCRGHAGYLEPSNCVRFCQYRTGCSRDSRPSR